jgi:hypothetical protein
MQAGLLTLQGSGNRSMFFSKLLLLARILPDSSDSAHERLTSIVVANFLLLHEVSRPELISFDEQAGQFSASSNRTSKEKSPARQRGIKYFN